MNKRIQRNEEQFKDNIKKAESMASQGDKFISVLSDSNKAEA